MNDRTPAPAGRRLFIDALRGLAVVMMIETHTLNALLDPELRGGRLHDAVSFVNGLVAPAFLFCAGLGFSLFLRRAGGAAGGDPPARPERGYRAYLLRILFIVAVGYSLHAPVFSLRGMSAGGEEAWRAFAQVDILQVIGVGLLALLAVARVFRSGRSRRAAVAALSAAALLWWYAAPADAASGLPFWLRAYVSRDLSPLFTAVPWAAFLGAGCLAGSIVAAAAEAGPAAERSLMARWTAGSAAAVAAAAGLSAVTAGLYGGDSYWYWSVEYFVIRLGAVLLVMIALWRAGRGGGGRALRALGVFGRESLAVYYLHLMVVYGRDVPWSFVRLWPAEFGYAACLALAAGLAALMYAVARIWSGAKRRRPALASLAVRGLAAGAALTFLLG